MTAPACTVAGGGFGRFAPVGLDDLVTGAALLTRVDRKYLLPTDELPGLLARLPDDVRVLEIDGRRTFAYRSVYFDTEALDSYRCAAHRRAHRFKIRLRCYVDSGMRFAEVKVRGARGLTVKHRVPYRGNGLDLGVDGRAVLAAAGIDADPDDLRLVLTTTYLRNTLLLSASGGRVTVDTDLSWALPDGTALHLPDRVVVETKSAGAASPVDRLLWSLHRRPQPVSKYATGLAALRPDLPAHRWLPVLRRHFTTTEMR